MYIACIKAVQAISMPLDVNEHVWQGCMSLGIQIIVPPLLLLVCHIALLFDCMLGEACDAVSQVSQKHSTLAALHRKE